MSDTTVATANNVQQFETRFFVEYNRASQFEELMGKSENNTFQINSKLEGAPGDQVTLSLVTTPTNSGQTGDNTLWGNEVNQDNYGHKITIDQIRNAVRVGRAEQKKTHIDLLKAAAATLKNWAANKLRSDIIEALQSPNLDGSTAYASCTEAQKDLWTDAQYAAGRILFGASKGNISTSAPAGGATYDHSASLLNVDGSGDDLDGPIISLAKRVARLGSHKIRPIKVDSGGEWYVLFCPTYAFRDAKSNLATYHEYASERGKNNPLFQDGDLMWDGVIIKEVPEIPTLSNVGNGGTTDVASCFLCGAQAVGIAYGESLHAIKDEGDYGNLNGVGVAEMRGIDKLMYNNIQHGVLTLYVANVADT